MELHLQQRPGNLISAHTFNYVCQGHIEDKDIEEEHKHRVDSENVTLKVTIKPFTKKK